VTLDDVWVGVAVAEGRATHQQLVDEHPEAVVVELIRVSLLVIDLGRDGMCGAADSVGSVVADPLGVSQVDESDPALVVDHEVGGLDVAVDEALAVHVPEDESDLAGQYLGEAGVEVAHHFEQFVEGQSSHWFQHHVQFVCVLEGVEQFVDAFGLLAAEVLKSLLFVVGVLDALGVFEGGLLDGLG